MSPFSLSMNCIWRLQACRRKITFDDTEAQEREMSLGHQDWLEIPPDIDTNERYSALILLSPDQLSVQKSLQNCALLNRLPLEIRQMIWGLCIGGRFLRSKEQRRKLELRCNAFSQRRCRKRDFCPKHSEKVTVIIRSPSALLFVCRQVYSEAINIFFSTNTFFMNSEFNNNIEYMPRLLLKQRIDMIRSIRFMWEIWGDAPIVPSSKSCHGEWFKYNRWVRTWGVLASMKSLQSLLVLLRVRSYRWDGISPTAMELLLEPIRKVTTPKRFTLDIGLPHTVDMLYSTRVNYAGDKAPFNSLPCEVEWA